MISALLRSPSHSLCFHFLRNLLDTQFYLDGFSFVTKKFFFLWAFGGGGGTTLLHVNFPCSTPYNPGFPNGKSRVCPSCQLSGQLWRYDLVICWETAMPLCKIITTPLLYCERKRHIKADISQVV